MFEVKYPCKLWCNNYRGWFVGENKDGTLKFSHDRNSAKPFINREKDKKELERIRRKVWDMGV